MKILYERMLKEHQRLDAEIKNLERQLQNYPEENFYCTKNGPYYKWYSSKNGISKHIPKSNPERAKKLATRKYLSLHLADLIQEKKAIEYYLRQVKNILVIHITQNN